MKYSSAQAFRRSLEDHIRVLYQKTGIPISRYRKLISFDRLLARLLIECPDQWVIKGGFMMELKFHQKARTTKDIDLLFTEKNLDIYQHLIKASRIVLGDWFQFEIEESVIAEQDFGKTYRYYVTTLLDSREFDKFHLDISNIDILMSKPVFLESSDYLGFAGIKPLQIPSYSIPQQIAEKYHALTRIYSSGEPSRVKDLVDILLIANTMQINATELFRCINLTFTYRRMHKIPKTTPEIVNSFSRNYSTLAKQVEIQQKTLLEGNQALRYFISPIFSDNFPNVWNPNLFQWE